MNSKPAWVHLPIHHGTGYGTGCMLIKTFKYLYAVLHTHTHTLEVKVHLAACVSQYVFILQLVGCETWMKIPLCVSMNKAFPDSSLTGKAVHTVSLNPCGIYFLYLFANPDSLSWTGDLLSAHQNRWTSHGGLLFSRPRRSKVKLNCLSLYQENTFEKVPKGGILDLGWIFTWGKGWQR